MKNIRELMCGALGLLAGQAASGEPAVVLDAVRVEASRQVFPGGATLSPTPAFEQPLSTTHLATDDVADRLPKDIADLADYAPGTARRANYWGVNTPTFQLRGFNAGDGNAYYKDGFRYQGRAPLAMANVDSITLLRGPQSAIYGWLEAGGAVQVNVKQPSRETIRTFALQADNWGRTGLSGDLGGPLDDDNRYRLVVAHEQGGSFRDRQELQQTLLAPSLARDFADGARLQLALEFLDDRRSTDYGIPAINGRPANVPVSRIYTEDWGRQHSQALGLTARWAQPAWGGDLTLAWSYYSLKYLEYRDVEPYSTTGRSIGRWYESYPERYRWLTGYADWSRGFGGDTLHHQITGRVEIARQARSLYGGEWDEYPAIDAYRPLYRQPWTPTADFSRYDQAWTNHSLGLVLQDEIRHGNWTWLLGTRFGYLRQVFDYADHLPVPYQEQRRQSDFSITPRLGVSWRATPTLALYANYSAGKLPTLPQNRAFDGASFDPLSSRQWESGLKMQSTAGHWLATLAWFDIERQRVPTTDPDHPGFSIQTGRQRSRGIEFQWQGRLAPGWQLTAQTTWLDTAIERDNRYTPGNRLPYAAAFGTSAWLTHSFAASGSGRWSLSGGFVHQGKRYADFANSAELPAFTRVDLGASYRRNDWSATLGIENLTDRRYYSSGVENRPTVIYPGAPRTLTLRLTQNFR